MKKTVLFLLILAMVLLTFSGCGPTTAEKIEALSGVWTITLDNTKDAAESLLDTIDAYPEEVALADLNSLDYVQVVEFTTDKTYRFAYDAEGTQACVKAFYESFFDALYEGRSTLNSVYEASFDDMTKEEFQQFYAEMYELASYEEMIDKMAETAYDYEELAEAWETGTYTIKGKNIMCTITGEVMPEALEYAIDGDTLTLTYSNGVEVYTKAN